MSNIQQDHSGSGDNVAGDKYEYHTYTPSEQKKQKILGILHHPKKY